MLAKVYHSLKRFGQENAKIRTDLIWNLASFVVMAVCGLSINIIIALLYSQSALGLFNQSFAFHIILSQIAVAGLQFSALKHVAENNHLPSGSADCIKSALLLGILLSTFVTLVFAMTIPFWAGILGSPELHKSLTYLLPGIFLFPLNKIMLLSINGLQHMRAYAIFNAARYFLICLCIMLLSRISTLEEASTSLSLGLCIPEIILFFLFALYLRRYLFNKFDFVNIWRWRLMHFKYIYKGAFNGILIEVNTRIDILMLGYFTNNATVGYYSFAATFAEGIKQITAIVKSNIDPLFSQFFSQQNELAVKATISKFRESIFPVILIVCILSIFAYPIGLRLLGIYSEYQSSILIFTILMISIGVTSYYTVFSGVIIQSGRPGWQSILVLITALLNILVCYFLIPPLGGLGAAIALAITFFTEAIFIAYWIKRLTEPKLKEL